MKKNVLFMLLQIAWDWLVFARVNDLAYQNVDANWQEPDEDDQE